MNVWSVVIETDQDDAVYQELGSRLGMSAASTRDAFPLAHARALLRYHHREDARREAMLTLVERLTAVR